MTHPYLFAAVQCRDERAFQEVRTVGVVMFGTDHDFAAIKLAPLAIKLGENADLGVIKAVLTGWEAELRDLSGRGPIEALRWLEARVGPSEDIVHLTPPTVGLSDDLAVTLRKIAAEYTGYTARGGQKWPERVITQVLRRTGMGTAFRPQTLTSESMAWKFPYVADNWLLHPIAMDQKRDSGVFDAAFHETGRFDEIRRVHPELRVLAVAPEAANDARRRALDIYREHRIEVVPADPARLMRAMSDHGLLSVGEAK